MAEGVVIHTNMMRPSHNSTPEDSNRVTPEVSMDAVKEPTESMTPSMDRRPIDRE